MVGFRHWAQGLLLIALFLVVIALPCYFVAVWGSRMINDIGNNPSKNAQIQAASWWKILAVEIVSFVLLAGLYIFLFNLENS